VIRRLFLLALLTGLASCASYREPTANCFAFRAASKPTGSDCLFVPLGPAEDGVEV
jgi:hypothetical protein